MLFGHAREGKCLASALCGPGCASSKSGLQRSLRQKPEQCNCGDGRVTPRVWWATLRPSGQQVSAENEPQALHWSELGPGGPTPQSRHMDVQQGTSTQVMSQPDDPREFSDCQLSLCRAICILDFCMLSESWAFCSPTSTMCSPRVDGGLQWRSHPETCARSVTTGPKAGPKNPTRVGMFRIVEAI